MPRRIFTILLLLASLPAYAFETVKVAEGIYALVGELGQRSPGNLGHNMTSGFIVTARSVVVVDTGGSLADAQAISSAIASVTAKPILYAINTGGQDHRWFGNAYFRKRGAKVIASEVAANDMRERGTAQLDIARQLLKESFSGTELAFPDITFQEHYNLPIDGERIELLYSGGAHTPGDIVVWLPQHSIVFAGDTVFAQRLLGIMPGSAERWIRSLEFLRDTLRPDIVIPGHGQVTTMSLALHDSYDYLTFLRLAIRERYVNGAFDPVEASQGLDQSRFKYLENYDDLRFRSMNAQAVAEEIYETVK
jgi:glyoxylase-like metal-dependent hydrolase (beta-lactamase superfamily II)